MTVMKSFTVLPFVAAILALGAAENLIYSTYTEYVNGDCGGRFGFLDSIEDISSKLDADGRFKGKCHSTSEPMSCIAITPIKFESDDFCVINVYEDESCEKVITYAKVGEKNEAQHFNNGGSWRSLNVQCNINGIATEKAFETAIGKGKRRWNDLQEKLKESEPKDREGGDKLLEGYPENSPNRKYKTPPPLALRNELKSLETDVDDEYYDKELKSKSNRVVFGDYYSVSQGVIIAANNDRTKDDHPKDEQLDLSEALFWEYTRLVNQQPDDDHIDIRKMQYHFRHQISNPLTLRIIDEIYRREKKKVFKDSLEHNAGKDNFLALLGTPNGVATPRMLQDHPVALGKKNVKRVKIVADENRHYHMYFAIG